MKRSASLACSMVLPAMPSPQKSAQRPRKPIPPQGRTQTQLSSRACNQQPPITTRSFPQIPAWSILSVPGRLATNPLLQSVLSLIWESTAPTASLSKWTRPNGIQSLQLLPRSTIQLSAAWPPISMTTNSLSTQVTSVSLFSYGSCQFLACRSKTGSFCAGILLVLRTLNLQL
jgi:hypothetical protein